MKFYETLFNEYINSSSIYDFHNENTELFNYISQNINAPINTPTLATNQTDTITENTSSLCKTQNKVLNQPSKFTNNFPNNFIIYGPSGSGKYTQMLKLIKPFSTSSLKYENKIFSNINKSVYYIHISDIHFELDFGILGCNSKLIWHDLFTQIVDFVSLKTNKIGFIVCKNFHEIHNELLEIFYNYMNVLSLSTIFTNQPNITGSSNNIHHKSANFSNEIIPHIKICFIILTEHISFIPTNIINTSHIISVAKPTKEQFIKGIGIQKPKICKNKIQNILNKINEKDIFNCKEIYSFALIDDVTQIPNDNFIIICENIIKELIDYSKNEQLINYTNLRDTIYDILIYNIDTIEAICYILFNLLSSNSINAKFVNEIISKLNIFAHQYGNNYRSFFHIEYILFLFLYYMKKTLL
jgi:hypothetical protein